MKVDSCTKPAQLCVGVSKWNGPLHSYLLRTLNSKECVLSCDRLVYRQTS